MKCKLCEKEADGEWTNPTNPKDKCPYCKKHVADIIKGFSNFKELVMLVRNVWGANE